VSLKHDEHDRELLRNVHPEDWTNPTPTGGKYDLVAIGAGTAGLIAASGAAGVGAKVALIERAHMGGDCLNVGCVPSKALLRAAHLAAEVRDAGRLGVRADNVEVDFGAVMGRMRRVRAEISPVDSVERYSNELGIDVFLGDARFTGPGEIEVDGKRLHFKKAVIATGARPFVPPIDGLEDAGYRTNETIFDLQELPARLLVIGGGPIGCEFAQAFQRFGSKVTMVEMEEQFLGREDPDAAAVLRASFERDGLDVRLATTTRKIAAQGREKLVTLETDGASETIAFDEILVAVGRLPNVEGMGLEEAGVEFDLRKGVVVDDNLRTSNRRIFAAGDVCLRTQFTHAADYAARIVIQNALFFGRKKLSDLNIPWCTYTSPEIAHVGLYERDADAQGVPIDTFTREMSEVDRAIAEGDPEGFVKIHTARGKDRILGATIVGHHAGDLISEVTVAMAAGLGLGGISNVIHPYPTRADAIRQTGGAYSRTRLTPAIARIFGWILRLQR
jgi:pyruvate/2-oxoglutarate dehydrogenase complex dihydrolipoamide dehydrogenase (E3) component